MLYNNAVTVTFGHKFPSDIPDATFALPINIKIFKIIRECFAPLAKRSFVRPSARQACASMGNLRNCEVISGDFLEFGGYFWIFLKVDSRHLNETKSISKWSFSAPRCSRNWLELILWRFENFQFFHLRCHFFHPKLEFPLTGNRFRHPSFLHKYLWT